MSGGWRLYFSLSECRVLSGTAEWQLLAHGEAYQHANLDLKLPDALLACILHISSLARQEVVAGILGCRSSMHRRW